MIIDYKGRQFVVELFGYLDAYKQEKGYLLSLIFNKNKKPGIQELEYKGKRILEVVV